MSTHKNKDTYRRAGITAMVTTWSVFAVLAACLGARGVSGLPMFARRYGVPCSTCHTSPPRLNETGYRFRAAGFRMPEEIGQKPDDQSRKITNHIGFRLQPRYLVTRTSAGGQTQTEHDVNLFAAEGYLWYGPVSRYFSTQLKVTVWPEESNETELTERVEGTLRFNYGNADNFVDIRAGVPHPHEGFGGSESYVVSDTKPFIQELKSANFNQDTFFTPLGFHMTGVSVGYYHRRTTIRGQLLSGLRVREKDGEVEPFGRKEPFTHAMPASNKGGPDFQIFFNQILHPEGGNVSLFYYNGRSYLPRVDLLPEGDSMAGANARAGAELAAIRSFNDLRALPPSDPLSRSVAARVQASATPVDVANLPFFKNTFHRLAFYAGYPIKRVRLLYGIQSGRDEIGSGGHFTSLGHFAEAMVTAINEISAVGVRYDWFDPARNKEHNEINGVTAYMNVWLHSELRVTPEFQHAVIRQGLLEPSHTENRFQLRLYWIR